ncbi:MAG: metalloregulator ArsR/SmtB family transcription factor [Desulfomonilaceae bacterium]|nr:metalloregulator ArsR/SmtB family transcription factor [Desulfomonilaceae bacterium]
MNAEEMQDRVFCAQQPKIEERPLLSQEMSELLEATFKDLANSTRLRLVHALIREPGMNVGDLAAALGMNITAISNHLRKLTDRGIVRPQRVGKQVNYSIVNPCTVSLLDHGLCLAEALLEVRPVMPDMGASVTRLG